MTLYCWRIFVMAAHHVFVTGGTGYLGAPLVQRLAARGHTVRALVRPGSEARLPQGITAVVGNALDAASFVDAIAPADTLVHLVGTPRPNPRKAAQFRAVDLRSIEASVRAGRESGVRSLVYVSVAQPAPLMRAYIAVRQQGEALVKESGIPATVLRPWYVLGPGHWWPYALVPLYAVLARIPGTKEGALRLGLVTRDQMIAALVHAVENPPSGIRLVDVPAIRARAMPRPDVGRPF